MEKLFAIAFLTIALASGLWAQAPVVARSVGLSPVPFWPRDGDTSQLPKGKYVFYDPPSAEYVVYYVGNPADATSAQPTILRFGSHALVDPEVTSAVAFNRDGSLHYAYDVANERHARQSIHKIHVSVFDDSSPRASDTNWTAKVEKQNERDLGTPATSLAAIEWTTNDVARSIAPGSAVPGFTIDSTALPGFITMVFQGESQSSQYTPDAVASLPKGVRDQLAIAMKTTWDARSIMVIGPRFPKDASPSTIAQNYSFGIQGLIRRGKLDANSPFVQRAQALFNEQLQAGDQTLLNAGSLYFTKQAKPGIEAAIANALETIFAK